VERRRARNNSHGLTLTTASRRTLCEAAHQRAEGIDLGQILAAGGAKLWTHGAQPE